MVPLVRESKPSIPTAGSGSARAAMVIAVSEPSQTSATQTAILERAEPASVVPLHRKKLESATSPVEREAKPTPQTEERASPETEELSELVLSQPPILASELLREQMEPSEPGRGSLVRLTTTACALGLLGACWLGGLNSLTYVSIALMVSMLTLALTPMSYLGHAIALFVAGSIASALGMWQQSINQVTPQAALLGIATVVLGGSLLYRAYYRGAKLARLAVSAGVVCLAIWFALSGGHQSLVRLDEQWQSWGPAVSHMAFALVALLSLLAFMEASTRGGAHIWAYSLLTLYTGHVLLLTSRVVWPGSSSTVELQDGAFAAISAGIVGTLVAAMALAQLFVLRQQSSATEPELAP